MGVPATQRKKIAQARLYRAPKLGLKDDEAQVVGTELHRIVDKHGKTPKAIYTHARPANSPLHQFFTWNLRAAAEKTWTAEALHLVRNVVVILVDDRSGEEVQHREFLLVDSESADEDGDSESRVVARQTVDLQEYRKSRVAQGFMEVRSFLRRFADLNEFKPIVRAMRTTLKAHDEEEGE